MSFMAGFGDAFQDSYQRAAQRRADKESEVFRYTYQDYLDRRKTKEENTRKDAEKVRKAKTLTDLAGAPSDAWTSVYNMLDVLDESTILKELRTGSFEEIETPANEETVKSGMAPASPTPPPIDQPSNGWDKIKSKLFGPKRNPRDKAVAQISQITGESPEQVTGTLDMESQAAMEMPQQRYKFNPAPPEVEPSKFDTIPEARLRLDQAEQAYRDNPNEQTEAEMMQAQRGLEVLKKGEQEDYTLDRKRKLQENVEDFEQQEALAGPQPSKFTDLRAMGLELQRLKRIDAAGSTPETRKKVQEAQEDYDLLNQIDELTSKRDNPSPGAAFTATKVKQVDPTTGQIKYSSIYQGQDGKWYTKGERPGEVKPVNPAEFEPVEEKEQQDGFALAKNFGEPLRKYQSRKSAIMAATRDFSDMGFLIRATNGEILAGFTMDMLDKVVASVKELNTFASVLSYEAGEQGLYDEAEVDRLEDKVDKEIIKLGSKITDLNTARALFNAKTKILAFRIGSMMGQENRSLSDKDRAIFEELAKGGYTPEQFYQNAGAFILSELDNLKSDERVLIDQNVDLQTFTNIYGGLPFALPKSIDEDIQSDQKVKGALEDFEEYRTFDITPNAPKKGKIKIIPGEEVVDDGQGNDYVNRNGKWVNVETGKEYVEPEE